MASMLEPRSAYVVYQPLLFSCFTAFNIVWSSFRNWTSPIYLTFKGFGFYRLTQLSFWQIKYEISILVLITCSMKTMQSAWLYSFNDRLSTYTKSVGGCTRFNTVWKLDINRMTKEKNTKSKSCLLINLWKICWRRKRDSLRLCIFLRWNTLRNAVIIT